MLLVYGTLVVALHCPYAFIHVQIYYVLLDFNLNQLFGVVQIEGNNANADDAIMLDKDGYVSETNATNIVRLHFLYFGFPFLCLCKEVGPTICSIRSSIWGIQFVLYFNFHEQVLKVFL